LLTSCRLSHCSKYEKEISSIKTEEFQINVPGGNIYAKKWLPENRISETPIILLHDSLGSVDLWRDFPSILARELSRSVVAYDRLGFGKSGAHLELPSIEFIEEEATKYFPRIKNHLSPKRYILLGHSVGGGMSINIAACDPDCMAVVTMAAQAFVEDLTVKGIKDAQKIYDQPGQLERLEKWHGGKAEWVYHAWTDVWLSPEFSDWSLESCIKNISCPVLAIHGDNDEYGSSAFPEFIAGLAGGEAKMLLRKDCGHMPHKEKTEEVVGAVKTFLSKNEQ